MVQRPTLVRLVQKEIPDQQVILVRLDQLPLLVPQAPLAQAEAREEQLGHRV